MSKIDIDFDFEYKDDKELIKERKRDLLYIVSISIIGGIIGVVGGMYLISLIFS